MNTKNRPLPLLLWMLTALLHYETYAQAQGNYTPQSPLAGQFEKYINYPVDHSTGAASVRVPLYTVKAGSIEVPVNLSYHTAGVKPTDPSLPVGLGWVINPGGRVTRKILGNPDESRPKQVYREPISPTTDLEYFQESEYNPPPSNQTGNSVDADHDIFTYQTGTGVTGRFIIQNQNSEYVAVPLVETHDRIKLNVVSGGGSSRIDYIEVTDANGTIYHFGKGLNSYSNSAASSRVEVTSGSAISGWMLTDIISADRADTVSLIWNNVRNSASNYYQQVNEVSSAVITDRWNSNPDEDPAKYPSGYTESPQFSHVRLESYHLMNVILGLRYKKEEIKFIYTDDLPTLLTRMEVYALGTKFREVDFHKSLFANVAIRLDSVSFHDKNNQHVNSYHFGYNPLTWPSSSTLAIDYWGYYNGGFNNTSLVPNFSLAAEYRFGTSIQSHSQTNRDPSEGRTQACILNSITYPTGGKTTYEYEGNKIYDLGTNQILPVGGLRVKSINHWSADGELAEKRTFAYGINESGAGDGLPMQTIMFTSTNMEYKIIAYDGLHSIKVSYRKRTVSSSPLGSLFTFDFPAVTYRSVTEYIGDKNGSNSGKIIYNYSQVQYGLRSFMPSGDRYAYMGRYWDQARLQKTTYYKNDQGTYTRVRCNTTSYNLFETDTIYSWTFKRYANFSSPGTSPFPDVVSLESNHATYFPFSSSFIFSLGSVYLYCGSAVPDKVRNVEYSLTGDSIVVEKTYEYPNGEYLYPSSLTQLNSDGTTSVTHFTYPKDYFVGSNPTNNVAEGIKLLKDRNVVSPVVEEYTEIQPGNFFKSGKFSTYKTDRPLPENTYLLKPSGTFSPATITPSTHTKSGSYLHKNTADLYDQYGNLRQMKDHIEGITIVLLYGYGGTSPIAVIRNATFSSVASVLGGSAAIDNFASRYPTDTEVVNFLSALRAALPAARVTTYTHKLPYGMAAQTDENGLSTYYEYDAFGRLQVIKDDESNVIKTYEYNYKR